MFDDSLLDDRAALARADAALRPLAEAGPRVRREAAQTAEACDAAVAAAAGQERPRAVIAAGPDSRLLRAVLEPWCPVPFVAWPGPGLPGWAGGLDLVVVLAPQGADADAASSAAEAVRRGCQLLVACPSGSMVAEHAAGRHTSMVPSVTGDQLAVAVAVLDVLHRWGLGPLTEPDRVADALDAVAIACAPHRDIAVNPAKEIALHLGDALPLVWGGSPLAARAARRVSEAIRTTTGRPALAGDADHLVPVLEATPRRDVFADPFEDGTDPVPALLVLDDGNTAPAVRAERSHLLAAASAAGVRVHPVDGGGDPDAAPTAASDLARYAALLSTGRWAATYLALASGRWV